MASVYDATFVMIKKIRTAAIVIAGPIVGEKVLDLCTGTGEIALACARQGSKVVGLDLSSAMLARAKRKNGAELVEWLEGDATDLPFENSRFDLVIISFGLHEMPKQWREKTLQEVRRVIKSSGRLIIVEFVRPVEYVGPKWLKKIGYYFLNKYECKYFQEYISEPLDTVIQSAGLKITKRSSLIAGFMEVITVLPS